MPMSPRLLRPLAARAGFNFDPTKLVLVFDTSLEPANNTVSVPINNVSGSPNVTIDWGDGTTSTRTTNGFQAKTYANPGVYVVQISGTMTLLSYGAGASTTNNKAKLVRCLSFGNLGLTSMSNAFRNCANLIQCPASLPTTSTVANCTSAFQGCTAFNDARVAQWNTALVTNMSGMFTNASAFNQPIGSWNTALVTNMSFMLNGTSFNQDISDWDIRKVVNMSSLFAGSAWGTANYDAALGDWADLADVGLPTGTTANTSQAITAFIDLDEGVIGVTSNGHGLAVGSRVSISGTTNYNGEYTNIGGDANTFVISKAFVANDATGTIQHRRSRSIAASFGANKYSAGAPTTARGVLTGTYLWTITDGGQV
jgi:surface protein